jgi:hypothetical protein
MSLVKVALSIIIGILALIGLLLLIPMDSYKSNPEVVGSNYVALHLNVKNSEYAVTENEVQEAFYSYMHKVCGPDRFNELSDSKECYSKLEVNFDSCIKTSMEYINLNDLNQSSLHKHFRSFKVCIE